MHWPFGAGGGIVTVSGSNSSSFMCRGVSAMGTGGVAISCSKAGSFAASQP